MKKYMKSQIIVNVPVTILVYAVTLASSFVIGHALSMLYSRVVD